MRNLLGTVLLGSLLVACSSGSSKPTIHHSSDPKLHVASPDWQDQIIYFVVTDRFANGDPANDDQHGGEYNPANKDYYSGGDLAGVREKLDYVQSLGATAIWVTPPVKNQWFDPQVQVAGYHGYWARDFDDVDEHLGDRAEFESLAIDLHTRGMYLIQDIVANHTGNFFDYDPAQYDPSDPTKGYSQNTLSTPTTHPTQSPFDENDPRISKDRTDAIYHWTPPIADYANATQVATYQLSNLDDLDTTNPKVRTALKGTYKDWIESGVDGFRIDTVLYVEHDFWNDFMRDPVGGILASAQATGRSDFIAFGETFVGTSPLDDSGDVLARSYLGTSGAPEMNSTLNFPLYSTINDVFGAGRPTHDLTYRLEREAAIYPDVTRLPIFIENHDTGRFLSRANVAKTREAFLLLLTLPGIPVIYYGSEQDFTETRGSMFAAGYGSGGTDHFDTTSAPFAFMKSAIAMRKANPVFSRGSLSVLADSAAGPGVFAFRRTYQSANAYVALNTSGNNLIAPYLETGLAAGTKLTVLLTTGFATAPTELTTDGDGKLTVNLPPNSALVALATAETVTVPTPTVVLGVTYPASADTITSTFTATGTVTGAAGSLVVVLDGNLDTTIPAPRVTGDTTHWTAEIPDYVLGNGQGTHTIAVYSKVGPTYISPPVTFSSDISLPITTVSLADPAGDATGPTGAYTLPDNPGFQSQLDVLDLAATATGNQLTVSVTMAQVTKTWNPPLGFDHVCFSIFLEIPGLSGGQTLMPKLNASVPAGMTWNRMAFIEGWHSNAYSSVGATATAYGNPEVPAPAVTVSGDTISFAFAPATLGNVSTLVGAKVYVTTWDFDGVQNVLRPLTPTAGPWAFGGGDGTVDPLFMDQTDVLEVQ